MISVKTVTLKEEAQGNIKTFMFSAATDDALLKSWADSTVKELNKSGNYNFSAVYGTENVYVPNEVSTLYQYVNNFIPIDYRQEGEG